MKQQSNAFFTSTEDLVIAHRGLVNTDQVKRQQQTTFFPRVDDLLLG